MANREKPMRMWARIPETLENVCFAIKEESIFLPGFADKIDSFSNVSFFNLFGDISKRPSVKRRVRKGAVNPRKAKKR